LNHLVRAKLSTNSSTCQRYAVAPEVCVGAINNNPHREQITILCIISQTPYTHLSIKCGLTWPKHNTGR